MRKRKRLFAAFLALGVGTPLHAQTLSRLAETNATRVEHAPKLNGALDDPLWQSATPFTDFHQREPYEGQPPTEKTEVRILYTRHAVYFGIHCYDSQPSRIVATDRKSTRLNSSHIP